MQPCKSMNTCVFWLWIGYSNVSRCSNLSELPLRCRAVKIHRPLAGSPKSPVQISENIQMLVGMESSEDLVLLIDENDNEHLNHNENQIALWHARQINYLPLNLLTCDSRPIRFDALKWVYHWLPHEDISHPVRLLGKTAGLAMLTWGVLNIDKWVIPWGFHLDIDFCDADLPASREWCRFGRHRAWK